MTEEASPSRWADLTCAQRRITDNTLDDNLPGLGSAPESRLRREPTVNAGALDLLPLELLHGIILELDLRSLANLRPANMRTTELVDSLPEYNDIIKHALNALRGILTIGTGHWITCRALHERLCTALCEQCGDFGGYLYLVTCRRVCFLCLSKDKLFLPLSLSLACRKFGLERRHLEGVPRMTAVPGVYSPNEKKVASAVTLVDFEHARLAGISLHGSSDAMDESVSRAQAQSLQAYHTRLAGQQSRTSGRRPYRPPTLDPFDGMSGNPLRFVAVTRVPWLDRASRRAEHGFYCVSCAKFSRWPLHWRRLFRPASFEEHLRQCGHIRDGKHHLL